MRLRLFPLLLIPAVVIAQVNPRNLLQKNCPLSKLQVVLIGRQDFHPFPKTSAEWKQVLPDSMLQALVKNGELALKQNFPGVPATITLDYSRNGNRTRYETITFGKRDRLWNLVLAEAVEDKKRFMDAIVDGIWSISEESFWGATAHLGMQKQGVGLPDVEDPVVDLFAAETAATLAAADYFLGGKLDEVSPLVRRRIYYEVNRRVFVPMETARYGWMGNGDTSARLNNWDPWIMSNYLAAALLLERDPTRRLACVNKTLQLTDQYINGIGDDGACEEGPHYWSAAAGCVLDVLDVLFSATGGVINIFHEPIIRNMGAYIYRTHIHDNYFVDVADSHPEVYPESIMVWRYGQAVDDTVLRSFGAWLYHHGGNHMNLTFHRTRMLYDLVRLRQVQQDTHAYSPVADVWLPDVQMMTTRIGNGLFLAAHGGNNGESHNHNDVGDFIVYAGGDPVIIDVGSGTYTSRTFSKDRYKLWFNTSAYHNLPTVNGYEQGEGSNYRANNVMYKKTSQGAGLEMDITGAFPSATGLTSWRRNIASNGKTITIKDNYACNVPVSSLTQTFMTVCGVDVSQPGKIVFSTAHGQKVWLEYDNGWRASKEPMQLETEEELGLKVTWRSLPITRVVLTRTDPRKTGVLLYKINLE